MTSPPPPQQFPASFFLVGWAPDFFESASPPPGASPLMLRRHGGVFVSAPVRSGFSRSSDSPCRSWLAESLPPLSLHCLRRPAGTGAPPVVVSGPLQVAVDSLPSVPYWRLVPRKPLVPSPRSPLPGAVSRLVPPPGNGCPGSIKQSPDFCFLWSILPPV